MGDAGTVTWAQLWSETAAVVGDRTRARWLCEVASGLDGDDFRGALDEPASERMVHHLDAMLERLRHGEPLQYVLGRWSFRRLDLMVDRRVLIPRPETEQVAERALRIARTRLSSGGEPVRIADLGTGSGAIGLALADELPIGRAEVWLTDVSADALDVARANVAGTGLAGAAARLAQGEWFAALPPELRGRFDVVVSNPPYVRDDAADLEAVVRDWEPGSALFGGRDGLDHLRTLIGAAPEWLLPGGALVLEVGADQGGDVLALLGEAGFVDAVVEPDLAGHDRIAVGRVAR